MEEAFIVDAVRTPVGRRRGGLASVHPADLAAQVLQAVVDRIPPPAGDPEAPLQALIFDSYFDTYRGVVSSVRVVNGRLHRGEKLLFMQAGTTHEVDEVGVRTPENELVGSLGPGEVGYLIAGIKDVREARSEQLRL